MHPFELCQCCGKRVELKDLIRHYRKKHKMELPLDPVVLERLKRVGISYTAPQARVNLQPAKRGQQVAVSHYPMSPENVKGKSSLKSSWCGTVQKAGIPAWCPQVSGGAIESNRRKH